MNCASCGKMLSSNVRFCNSCGTPAPVTSVTQSAPVVFNSSTVTAKSFCCSGCGAPLKIPKNSKGHVQCPSCRNDCVLEGITRNAEVAAEDNINSGFPLDASPAVLHRQLVSHLYESPYIPLDVFDKTVVVREDRYCVSAYCFDCSASSGSAYFTGTVFAPGSKYMATQIAYLYAHSDTSKLVDIKELEYPVDVETLGYNLSHLAAFKDYVKPLVEKALLTNTKSFVRNLSMTGGSKIDKDITRVFLGLYHVVYNYGGQEYSMWTTGDGLKNCYDKLPIDLKRKAVYDEKKASAAGSKKKLGCAAYIGTIVLAIIIGMVIGGSTTADTGLVWGFLLTLIAATACKVIGEVLPNRQLDMAKEDFIAFDAQRKSVIQRFHDQKKPLRGIYEKLT